MFPRWRIVLSDGFSFGFLITAIISVFIFEMYVVLPEVEEHSTLQLIHSINGTFIFINIVANLFMVMKVDTSTKRIILPSLLKPMWHFCSTCEANAPPRTHHCDKCNCCVFKRDHHCAFTGCCIGLKNFRYFLVFLFYLAIGSCYATVLNMYFIWDVLGGFSFFSVAAHIVPFVFWLFGYLSLPAFVFTMLSVLAIVGFLFVGNLFIFHAQNMLRNQTTFEKNQGVKNYDLGWRQNLEQSLGARWYKNLIFPYFASPLTNDGLSFATNQPSPSPVPQPLTTGNNLRQRRL